MSATHLQDITSVDFASTTTVSATFAALTPGSFLVAVLSGEYTSGIATVADTVNSGNWTLDATRTNPNTIGVGYGTANVFSKLNTSSAGTTVTATVPSSCSGSFKIFERSATAGTGVDSTGGGNGAPGGLGPIAASITTVNNNVTIYAALLAYPTPGSVDTGFTASGSNGGLYGGYALSEYDLDAGTSPGALAMNFGHTASDNQAFCMAIAAYKDTVATGTRLNDDYSNFPKMVLRKAA